MRVPAACEGEARVDDPDEPEEEGHLTKVVDGCGSGDELDCGDSDGTASERPSACGDCIVSFIVGREPGDALVIDAEEERALRTLSDGGLVPQWCLPQIRRAERCA